MAKLVYFYYRRRKLKRARAEDSCVVKIDDNPVVINIPNGQDHAVVGIIPMSGSNGISPVGIRNGLVRDPDPANDPDGKKRFEIDRTA